MSLDPVKRFNAQKGRGYITPQETSGYVFAHLSALERADIDQFRERQKASYKVPQDLGRRRQWTYGLRTDDAGRREPPLSI